MLFTLVCSAAEKSFSIRINDTLFSVTKGDVYSCHQLADIMVVGRNQQRQLQAPSFGDSRHVGKIHCLDDKIFYAVHKELDSASNDDTYKPFMAHDTDLWRKAEKKKVDCKLLEIIEPRIMYRSVEYNGPKLYGYFPTRVHTEQPGTFINPEFFGDDAMDQAGNDLAVCYNTALDNGLEILKPKKDTTIILSELAVEVGFPGKDAAPIAFKAIIDFIAHNSGYAYVQLFVKKHSQFLLYHALREAYFKNT